MHTKMPTFMINISLKIFFVGRKKKINKDHRKINIAILMALSLHKRDKIKAIRTVVKTYLKLIVSQSPPIRALEYRHRDDATMIVNIAGRMFIGPQFDTIG